MPLSDDLRTLRTTYPDCRAVVLGDTATSTVLYACAHESCRQEDHDALLVRARTAFSDPFTTLTRNAQMEPSFLSQVMISDADGATLFLRLEQDPDEVYCIAASDIATLPTVATSLSEIICNYAE